MGDAVVNQLLTKIDGMNALNNILLIGMTNRIDMLDETLLRSGRMDCHIRIGLPDLDGRYDILKIHTRSLKRHKKLDASVNIRHWAEATVNFSGMSPSCLSHWMFVAKYFAVEPNTRC